VFLLMAIGFALFALRKHLSRFEGIKDEEVESLDFEDQWGPVVLVVTYCVVVLIVGTYYVVREAELDQSQLPPEGTTAAIAIKNLPLHEEEDGF